MIADDGGPAPDPLAALRAAQPRSGRDRVRAWIARIPDDARPWALALALVLAAVLVVAAMTLVPGWMSPSTGGSATEASLAELPFAGTATTMSTPTTTSAEVLVHAAGSVVAPGLYRLPTGSRVGDLLDAAGGVAPEGDTNRINLAAPLADGERVYVPRVGELEVPPIAVADEPTIADSPSGATAVQPLDLNRATAEQLEELPGVGPSIAGAIVDHRETSGAFRSVDDLLEVRGIGPARLEQLRDLVRV